MTIWERTKAALTGLGVQMAANVLLVTSGSDYPDLYLVYMLISAPSEQFADNKETVRSYRMQVSVYSRTGLVSLPDVNSAMVAAGFARSTMTELPFNQVTKFYGLALEFIFVESEN